MTRHEECKQHVYNHISACSPCTFSSVLSWARSQGVAAGFVQNFNELKHEGKVCVYEEDFDDGKGATLVVYLP